MASIPSLSCPLLTTCQDYNITYYCAELVNTLTNLMFIYLGLKGIRNVVLYSQDPIFILAFMGYLVVGLGSMAFHATLKCRSISHLISHLMSDRTQTNLLQCHRVPSAACSLRPISPPDSMQLADELPMIYTTCIMGYVTFSYSKSRLYSLGVAAGFASLAWWVTVSTYFSAPSSKNVSLRN